MAPPGQKSGDDIQADDFFRVIREDQQQPGILYAGAERGFYISFDGGKHFHAFQLNLPVVPINDIVIRDNGLAIATAGRSFWVLDDLSAIQQSQGNLSKYNLKLFEPKIHYRLFGAPPFFLITEHAFGKNPPEGVSLDYYIAQIDDRKLKLEIINESGEVIRTVEGTKEEIKPTPVGGRGNLTAIPRDKLPLQQGLNRFVWDFRTQGLIKLEGIYVQDADYRGHRVAPGKYVARMTYGEDISEASITILDPPDLEIPPIIWDEQQRLMDNIEEKINEMHEAIKVTMQISEKINSINGEMEGKEDMEDLQKEGEQLSKKVKEWQGKVIELRQKGFQDALNWPAGLNSEFFLIRNNLDTYDPHVPAGYKTRYSDLEGQWLLHQQAFEELMDEEVKSFNELYKSKGLDPLSGRKKELIEN